MPNATAGVASVLRSLRFAPGDRARDHRSRVQRRPEHGAFRRGPRRGAGRGRPDPAADHRARRGRRAGPRRRRPADAPGPREPRDEPHGARPARRAPRRDAGGARDPGPGRRRPRAGDAAARPAGARRELLRRQPPQVGLRPEGRRVPPRAARPAGGDPARWPSATGRTTRGPVARPSARSSTGRGRPTRRRISRCPRRSTPSAAWSPAAGRPSWAATPTSPRSRAGPWRSAAGPPVLAPETMLGSMAAIELPQDRGFAARGPADPDPLQARLLRGGRDRGAAPCLAARSRPRERRRRLLRVSAHLHNDAGEYAYLAEALRVLLAEERR